MTEGSEHRREQLGVVSQAVPDVDRQAEHPLTHRSVRREDVVHQPRNEFSGYYDNAESRCSVHIYEIIDQLTETVGIAIVGTGLGAVLDCFARLQADVGAAE
jgi:hypothetical protein